MKKLCFAIVCTLVVTACVWSPIPQADDTIFNGQFASFEEITAAEYRKAESTKWQCTQLPDSNISPELKQKIIEEIFDKVLGDEGSEFALMVDTLISIYGYYPALGAIAADAAECDVWDMQRGWLFDTTGQLLGGGFSVIGMAVRSDGLIATLGISNSGFPSTPDTLLLLRAADGGRQMEVQLQRRFDTDSTPGTITDWLPQSFFWGADSALYISGFPRTKDDVYYDNRNVVYYRLKLTPYAIQWF